MGRSTGRPISFSDKRPDTLKVRSRQVDICSMQTTDEIFTSLLRATSDTVDVEVVPGQRFVTVMRCQADDNVLRQIATHSHCMGAMRELMQPEGTWQGEFFIDTGAPLNACVYPVDYDEDDMLVLDRDNPRSFDKDTLLFL
jgi:hypothetical protein